MQKTTSCIKPGRCCSDIAARPAQSSQGGPLTGPLAPSLIHLAFLDAAHANLARQRLRLTNPHPATPGLLSARTSAHRECRRCLFSHISALLFVVSTRSKPTLACPSPCSRPFVAALPAQPLLFSFISWGQSNHCDCDCIVSQCPIVVSTSLSPPACPSPHPLLSILHYFDVLL